jgi:hypothetical protein
MMDQSTQQSQNEWQAPAQQHSARGRIVLDQSALPYVPYACDRAAIAEHGAMIIYTYLVYIKHCCHRLSRPCSQPRGTIALTGLQY